MLAGCSQNEEVIVNKVGGVEAVKIIPERCADEKNIGHPKYFDKHGCPVF